MFSAKTDAVAAGTIVAAWVNKWVGFLNEFFTLLATMIAVVYGLVRLWETKTIQEWVRRRRNEL